MPGDDDCKRIDVNLKQGKDFLETIRYLEDEKSLPPQAEGAEEVKEELV